MCANGLLERLCFFLCHKIPVGAHLYLHLVHFCASFFCLPAFSTEHSRGEGKTLEYHLFLLFCHHTFGLNHDLINIVLRKKEGQKWHFCIDEFMELECDEKLLTWAVKKFCVYLWKQTPHANMGSHQWTMNMSSRVKVCAVRSVVSLCVQ